MFLAHVIIRMMVVQRIVSRNLHNNEDENSDEVTVETVNDFLVTLSEFDTRPVDLQTSKKDILDIENHARLASDRSDSHHHSHHDDHHHSHHDDHHHSHHDDHRHDGVRGILMYSIPLSILVLVPAVLSKYP